MGAGLLGVLAAKAAAGPLTPFSGALAGDRMNDALLSNISSRSVLAPPSKTACDESGYCFTVASVHSPSFAVFASLATCDGSPPPRDAVFVRAGGSKGGCALQAPITPVAAFAPSKDDDGTRTPFFGFRAPNSDASVGPVTKPGARQRDAKKPWMAVDEGDARVALVNAPSGCYRLAYSYAPRGVVGYAGSLSHRTVTEPVASAQATGIALGRPFMYLSPVTAVVVDASAVPPTVGTMIGVPLLEAPSVSITVRAPFNATSRAPFRDTCSDGQMLGSGLGRCPRRPAGGLEVFVSAVDTSGNEYALYDGASAQNDCRRAVAVNTSAGDGTWAWTYKATFSGLYFPLSPQRPPRGPGSTVTSYAVPPGTYRLKFSAYGMSALSAYTVVVRDTPNLLVPSRPPSPLQPLAASMAAARVSLSGASPLSSRQPRLNSGSPEVSM
jgi:hypothetical protein